MSDGGWTKISGGAFWKPAKEGDSVMGLYKAKEPATGKFEGENAILETPGGATVKVGISGGLKSSFAMLSPGKIIRITYRGWGTSATGRQFKNYDVELADDGVTLDDAVPF